MKVKFNSNVVIYFVISWIVSIIFIGLAIVNNDDDYGYTLIFINLINFFINFLIIISLLVLMYVFTEKRKEFSNSLILLIFNFPFIMSLYIILFILKN